VINHLQEKDIPFIIPYVARGKSGGIRRPLRGRKSYSTEYTMRSNGREASFQVKVNIVARYYRGKWDRHGVEYFAFAVYGIDMPAGKTHREYRKRFGVELQAEEPGAAQDLDQEPRAQAPVCGTGVSPGEHLDLRAVDVPEREKKGREEACLLAFEDHAPAGFQGA
jgi:hypothetical protein